LVNNAAIAFKSAATEPFGHQAKVTVATNYFSVKNTCKHLFPLLRSGARVVNVSSSCGFLHRIPDELLKQKLADDKLTSEELDGLMNDFIDGTQDGTHSQKGWTKRFDQDTTKGDEQ
jgi:carbonyl reductase 1